MPPLLRLYDSPRVLAQMSGSLLKWEATHLLLFFHDTFYALAEFFEGFTLFYKFENCFQKCFSNVHLIHVLTSFSKSFLCLTIDSMHLYNVLVNTKSEKYDKKQTDTIDK